MLQFDQTNYFDRKTSTTLCVCSNGSVTQHNIQIECNEKRNEICKKKSVNSKRNEKAVAR